MTSSSAIDHLRVASSFQESCVLIAMAELDIATRILEHSNTLTAEELAALCNLDLRALTVLLDALAGLGYFVKTHEHYSVATSYIELFDIRHPNTFIPMLRHQGNCLRSWSQLARVVTDGKQAERTESILGAESDSVSFILAMNSVGRALAAPMVEELKKAQIIPFDSFEKNNENFRILDIGGASGTYTKAFLEAFPQAECTIFDLPVAIKEAKKRFAGTAWKGKVSFAEGDFYKDEFPTGFDFAWISAIIHQHGVAESQALFAKTERALKPGGRVAVRDFVMDATRTSPAQGTLFGINMLVGTKNGIVYTYDEIREALEAAGFIQIRLAVPADTMSAVVVAEKLPSP